MIKYLVFFLLMCIGWPLKSSSVEVVEYEPVRKHYFPEIYAHIRSEIEGNYVNHPKDKGAETYGGIARKLHPDWYGWKYVDADKSKFRGKRIEACEIWVLDYYLTLWVKEGFENIEDKDLALNLFDFRIHSSPRSVTRLTNNVLREMGIEPVKVGDNWIDDRFNHIDSKEFILRLKIQRLILFNGLVSREPAQKVFYRGWVNRLYDI